MTGLDLDQAFRNAARKVTRENILTIAKELIDLGFPAIASFQMLSDIVIAKERTAEASDAQ